MLTNTLALSAPFAEGYAMRPSRGLHTQHTHIVMSETLPEVAGIGVGRLKLLSIDELLPHSAEPDQTGITLSIQGHTHPPHDGIAQVIERAMPGRRPCVDDLVRVVLALQIRACHVKTVAAAAQEHRARHRVPVRTRTEKVSVSSDSRSPTMMTLTPSGPAGQLARAPPLPSLKLTAPK